MNIDIYIETNDIISIDKVMGGKIDPILWCRNGEYRIIPREVVGNTIDILNMYVASDGKRTQPTPVIQWSQGIPISNQAGRVLVGE